MVKSEHLGPVPDNRRTIKGEDNKHIQPLVTVEELAQTERNSMEMKEGVGRVYIRIDASHVGMRMMTNNMLLEPQKSAVSNPIGSISKEIVSPGSGSLFSSLSTQSPMRGIVLDSETNLAMKKTNNNHRDVGTGDGPVKLKNQGGNDNQNGTNPELGRGMETRLVLQEAVDFFLEVLSKGGGEGEIGGRGGGGRGSHFSDEVLVVKETEVFGGGTVMHGIKEGGHVGSTTSADNITTRVRHFSEKRNVIDLVFDGHPVSVSEEFFLGDSEEGLGGGGGGGSGGGGGGRGRDSVTETEEGEGIVDLSGELGGGGEHEGERDGNSSKAPEGRDGVEEHRTNSQTNKGMEEIISLLPQQHFSTKVREDGEGPHSLPPASSFGLLVHFVEDDLDSVTGLARKSGVFVVLVHPGKGTVEVVERNLGQIDLVLAFFFFLLFSLPLLLPLLSLPLLFLLFLLLHSKNQQILQLREQHQIGSPLLLVRKKERTNIKVHHGQGQDPILDQAPPSHLHQHHGHERSSAQIHNQMRPRHTNQPPPLSVSSHRAKDRNGSQKGQHPVNKRKLPSEEVVVRTIVGDHVGPAQASSDKQHSQRGSSNLGKLVGAHNSSTKKEKELRENTESVEGRGFEEFVGKKEKLTSDFVVVGGKRGLGGRGSLRGGGGGSVSGGLGFKVLLNEKVGKHH